MKIWISQNFIKDHDFVTLHETLQNTRSNWYFLVQITKIIFLLKGELQSVFCKKKWYFRVFAKTHLFSLQNAFFDFYWKWHPKWSKNSCVYKQIGEVAENVVIFVKLHKKVLFLLKYHFFAKFCISSKKCIFCKKCPLVASLSQMLMKPVVYQAFWTPNRKKCISGWKSGNFAKTQNSHFFAKNHKKQF